MTYARRKISLSYREKNSEGASNLYKRDTKNCYLEFDSPPVSDLLVQLALKSLSGRVLDFGGATGGYSKRLFDNGLEPVCVDINRGYLKKAAPLDRVASDTKLPFKRKSFDGAICFEILEHLADPPVLLEELRRCVNGKIVVSVPNCRGTEALIQHGLIYEHYMEEDHRNFYDQKSLFELLSGFFDRIEIREVMPVGHYLYDPGGRFGGLLINKLLKAQIKIFRNLGLVKRRYYGHLVAICGPNGK